MVQKQHLSIDHVGYIAFGGEVEIKDGIKVTMKFNPFSEAFTEAKIKSAREKCGYWPATRNALKSKKVRHVLKTYEESISNYQHNVDDDNDSTRSEEAGEEDDDEHRLYDLLSSAQLDDNHGDKDVQEELLQAMEDLNMKTVFKLVRKGYIEVEELGTRTLTRECNSEDDGESDDGEVHNNIRAEPNTRARQDQLAKAKTAGQFFKLTMGGDILNSSDYLIGLARKGMKKDAEALEKQKKAIQAYEKVAEAAETIVFSKPYPRWTAKDFKIAIKFKQGLKAPDDRKWNQSAKLSTLKDFYETHYKRRPRLGPDQMNWTEEDEAKLNRLKSGEISSVDETTMYGRCLEARKHYLVQRVGNLSPQSRLEVLEELLRLLSHEEKNKLGFVASSERTSIDHNAIDFTSLSQANRAPIPRLLLEILEDCPIANVDNEDDEQENGMEVLEGGVEQQDKDDAGVASDTGSVQSSECSFSSLLNPRRYKDNDNQGSGDCDSSESSSDLQSVADEEENNADKCECITEIQVFPKEIKVAQLTMKMKGLELIRDELSERGIHFDDTMKIRELKKILIKEGLNGKNWFEPKSALIIQCIKDGLLN